MLIQQLDEYEGEGINDEEIFEEDPLARRRAERDLRANDMMGEEREGN